MEKKIISVEHLLENSELFIGKIVTVEGRLMATFYDVSLVPLSTNSESYDISLKIRIDHADLTNKCFEVVSPWVGGRFYYQDQAIVTGKLVKEVIPILTDLTGLKLIRETKEYEIISPI